MKCDKVYKLSYQTKQSLKKSLHKFQAIAEFKLFLTFPSIVPSSLIFLVKALVSTPAIHSHRKVYYL